MDRAPGLMLRAVLIAISIVVLLGAVALAFVGAAVPGVFTVLVWAAILFVGVVFERSRYKDALDHPPGPDFEPTTERFVDPTSGAATVVWFNAKTGQRAYVKAP